jgi:hypothetical protein
MATKQLVKHSQGLVEAAQGLSVRKGELVPSPAFIEALKAAIEIENELKQFFGAVKTEMEIHGVTEISGDYGYLKLEDL